MLEVQKSNSYRYDKFEEISNLYHNSLKRMFGNAGGQTRHKKEHLVVDIAESILETAINEAGIDKDRVFYSERDKVETPSEDSTYLSMIDPIVANVIADDLRAYKKEKEVDFNIFVDNKLAIVTELKAYADTAMLKKFIYESTRIRETGSSKPSFALFQLENALGGDYDRDVPVCMGSMQVHGLLSEAKIDIRILTLLDGKRTSTRPIHDKMFSKRLSWYKFNKVVDYFRDTIIVHAEQY